MAARGAGGCADAGKKGGKVAGFRRRNYGKKLFADRGLEGNSRTQIAGLEETGAV